MTSSAVEYGYGTPISIRKSRRIWKTTNVENPIAKFVLSLLAIRLIVGVWAFWVDADPKLRYERIQTGSRGRIDDQKSFEEFVYEEQREISPVSADPASVDLGAVSRIADVRIENNFDDESAYIDSLLDQHFSER